MSANQIAEISPGLREAIAGGDNLCATFVIAGDENRWIQFVGGTVNAAYPHTQDPAPLIMALGDAVIESFEPGQYVTVRLQVVDVYSIARWIDRYFEQVLAADNDYSVDVTLESL